MVITDYEYGLEGNKIMIFKVIFQCQKSVESFCYYSLKNISLGAQLLLVKKIDRQILNQALIY